MVQHFLVFKTLHLTPHVCMGAHMYVHMVEKSKSKKSWVVVHICNPRTKAEVTGSLQDQSQPGLHSEF